MTDIQICSECGNIQIPKTVNYIIQKKILEIENSMKIKNNFKVHEVRDKLIELITDRMKQQTTLYNKVSVMKPNHVRDIITEVMKELIL